MQKDLCGKHFQGKQELNFCSRDQHRTKTVACQITPAFRLPPDLLWNQLASAPLRPVKVRKSALSIHTPNQSHMPHLNVCVNGQPHTCAPRVTQVAGVHTHRAPTCEVSPVLLVVLAIRLALFFIVTHSLSLSPSICISSDPYVHSFILFTSRVWIDHVCTILNGRLREALLTDDEATILLHAMVSFPVCFFVCLFVCLLLLLFWFDVLLPNIWCLDLVS